MIMQYIYMYNYAILLYLLNVCTKCPAFFFRPVILNRPQAQLWGILWLIEMAFFYPRVN